MIEMASPSAKFRSILPSILAVGLLSLTACQPRDAEDARGYSVDPGRRPNVIVIVVVERYCS